MRRGADSCQAGLQPLVDLIAGQLQQVRLAGSSSHSEQRLVTLSELAEACCRSGREEASASQQVLPDLWKELLLELCVLHCFASEAITGSL